MKMFYQELILLTVIANLTLVSCGCAITPVGGLVTIPSTWNIVNNVGNFNNLLGAVNFEKDSTMTFIYQFKQLRLAEDFTGTKHQFKANIKVKKIEVNSLSNILNTTNNLNKTSFNRSYNSIKYHLDKIWFGGNLNFESNEIIDATNDQLQSNSHQFINYNAFVGIGDSTKIHAELGYYLELQIV